MMAAPASLILTAGSVKNFCGTLSMNATPIRSPARVANMRMSQARTRRQRTVSQRWQRRRKRMREIAGAGEWRSVGA
jgi:hypothetical protein